MTKLYYQAPSDQIFYEVILVSQGIWLIYQDKETAKRIAERKNIRENFMYTVAELDQDQQTILFNHISHETQVAISDRVKSVNDPATVKTYYSHMTL